jgi:hypothetical protein
MPLTNAGREALEALYRESADHELRYSNTLYQHIPAIDKRAQKMRDIEIFTILEAA